MAPEELKSVIVQRAKALGFMDVRMARAEALSPEKERLRSWLNGGRHGTMSYMENHFDKRTDPRELLPGTETVICLAYNYYSPQKQEDDEAPKLSMYAYGRDYHKVIKKKLKALLQQLKAIDPELKGRAFVDSAPILERDWARRSGLGWVGKNTMIIHPRRGSFFFLSELLINKALPADAEIEDYCGTCTRCIDACPTEAIDQQGYLMDGSRCISYLTIEHRSDELPPEFKGKMDNWMFGCDICQEVCPWNRFSVEHAEEDFRAHDDLLKMTRQDWQDLTEEKFETLFYGSAVKRTKYEGLKRNIDFLDAS